MMKRKRNTNNKDQSHRTEKLEHDWSLFNAILSYSLGFSFNSQENASFISLF